MKLLITGGAGFLGARLARTLLAKGELAGKRLTQVVLADQFPAPPDLAADPRVEVLTGPLLDQCAGLDLKSTRLNSSHSQQSRMPSSA